MLRVFFHVQTYFATKAAKKFAVNFLLWIIVE